MNFSSWKRLFRIEHAFILAVAVLFSLILASSAFSLPLPGLTIILASLAVPFFIEMGSFALNDWFDVKTDKENKREDRPIASGEIKKSHALYASLLTYAIGIGAAFLLPPIALYIAVAFAVVSVAYNWFLKDLPLIGNLYIAASMAIPFVFGNLVISEALYSPLLAIAAVAFVSGLGREILKSTEDVEGDVKHRKSKTLPAVIGKKNSAYAAAACYALLVPLSYAPYATGLEATIPSLILVTLTALAFAGMAVKVAQHQGKSTLKSARKTSFFALGVGLLGYAASLI